MRKKAQSDVVRHRVTSAARSAGFCKKAIQIKAYPECVNDNILSAKNASEAA
ncbi:hypothetical protein [Undibacterium squillarum]|uniref:hypothetical protein n=1 Tax=Undibacterium squillarum TaxID=1131567 RepID=UPI0035B43D18